MSKHRKALILAALLASNLLLAKPTNLTIYSEEFFAAEWGPGQEIKALFEKSHPQCEITFIPFDSRATILNRLRLEGKNTKADVVLGLDNQQIESAEKTRLFDAHQVDLSSLSLPVAWKNQTFLPYDFGQYAFIYDKSKLKNPPQSMQELLERKDLRIIYQDPRTSSLGRGLIIWINSLYPQEQVPHIWQQLAQHTVTVGKGWTETYGAFLKEEADLVFSYDTSPLYHLLNEQKDQYSAAKFSEKSVLQIETVAKIAGRHNTCADSFLPFLISPEAQKIIIPKNVMLSVINANIEPHYDALKAEKTEEKNIDPLSISDAQLKQWIDVWQTAVSKSQ
ncbi:MAG: thiamine ABC transporter substrate binding subunit [Cardiobacteriaceae bacterium]|nr:thiamine ABC transporter substrate binding subunit [Cardiobacteriaceae bacterium]